LGVRRFADLVVNGGVDSADLAEVVAYGERRMRAALAALPDGTWTFEDVIDSVGAGADQQHPATIRVAVTVVGDRVRFDFAGTDPQATGNVNAVAAVTISAVSWALRSVLDPTIGANGGALRSVEVIAPPGSLVAAQFPAAVGAGNVEVSQRVADVCLGALAQAVPHRVGAASQGTMNNLVMGGSGWVSYETIGGGQGGRPPRPGSTEPAPGMSGVHTAMTNTKNTPIEALERAFPLRVLRQRLRRGSGGAGVAPGGEGIERDLQVLEDATVSLITERRVSQPWGLAGGEPGSAGENWLLPQGDEVRAERLPDKCTIQLKAGDVLRMLTPGGGGWGDPAWSNAGTEAGQTGISRRADNPALLAGLPDRGVDVDVVVADVEAGRASR
jgi:N-methylhydantoinase B/oxoprolinase/acetone carboxylase alpha subunit